MIIVINTINTIIVIIIDYFTKDNKITEQFSAICDTNCAMLVLVPEYYNLVNIETVKIIYEVPSLILS
jgi:hypothetical protein